MPISDFGFRNLKSAFRIPHSAFSELPRQLRLHLGLQLVRPAGRAGLGPTGQLDQDGVQRLAGPRLAPAGQAMPPGRADRIKIISPALLAGAAEFFESTESRAIVSEFLGRKPRAFMLRGGDFLCRTAGQSPQPACSNLSPAQVI